MTQAVADALRDHYGRAVARTLALTRNLAEAEDAVHEAVLRALANWPVQGIPELPAAWLATVAGNAHRDRLRQRNRQERTTDALEELAAFGPWVRAGVGTTAIAQAWKDDLLRVVFACCHPSLEPGESAALCLCTILGLSTREVALAFVTAPRTMEQRLARARRRLREHGDPDGTAPEQARDRLPAVLRVVHLLFNEGYWSSHAEQPIRRDLCRLAIGLGRALAAQFAGEPEVMGLLALLLLHDARHAARLDADGQPVPLPEQDRARWDRDAMREGFALLDAALACARPGPFQVEAAISATHCHAASAAATDWREIAELYRHLEAMRPSAVVRVQRAFAVGRADGPAAGLRLLDAADAPRDVDYAYAHLVRGELLAELGDVAGARAALQRAADVARNPAERRQISARLTRLEHRDPT